MQTSFSIYYEWDIVHMRSEIREIAKQIGFNELDQARIVQSISELARNVIQHAKEGSIRVSLIEKKENKGLRFEVCDSGPGIPNLRKVIMRMKRERMGDPSGLQQVLMLMDDFSLKRLEKGVCVEVIKWLRSTESNSV